ncbi:Hypothetical predicted protein [Olea europaea subsp. europaea]|uniref:Uncharacterized protein n=1 Tax=Olea europaea subsp. europaea TaxID=158383 RepID=A0A8S0VLU3_OLEEU|nr:Hypothetical predicted protein [Olea europaea subsp. europaea]
MFLLRNHAAFHQYPPVPEAGDLSEDAAEPSGSSHYVAETEVDDAADAQKKRKLTLIEDSDDSTGSTPAKDLKAKSSTAASPSAPPSKKSKRRALLDELSLSSDSILGHLDSKEQVANSQDGAPSLEELAAPPQPLRRIRRDLGGDDLDVVAAPSTFAPPADYLQHVSLLRVFSSSSSPRARA